MPAELSPYEVQRLKNIEENKRVLKELGLYKPFQLEPRNIQKRPKQLTRKRKQQSESPVPSKLLLQRRGLDEEAGSSFASGVRKSRRLIGLKPRTADEVDADLSKADPDADYTPTKPVRRENSFGAIEGVEVGQEWMMRIDCSRDGIHRPTVAGIHGNEEEGCYSLALSGGYEDDLDLGESFTYTGEGGRDLKGTKANPKNLRTAPQSRDQTLTRGNLALTRNIEFKRPVRVIRGYKLDSPYAPEEGYRYDGVYMVEKYWFTTGLSGFGVYKFALRRCEDQASPPWEVVEPSSPGKKSDSAYSSQSERETSDAGSEPDKGHIDSDTSELSPASSPASCPETSSFSEAQ
ncbi:E3 ubiquitin-protein ligase UHRF1-like isoform X2 [Acanthaster planci]|nr:E3 ubiquitin-protein ligase UHRF1-like isoform X2 [Acanthaster planci]XP_022109614.1 E3 ubiquitin-protein ligase UHRF1-like isoform X2 [Acanthaster planci]